MEFIKNSQNASKSIINYIIKTSLQISQNANCTKWVSCFLKIIEWKVLWLNSIVIIDFLKITSSKFFGVKLNGIQKFDIYNFFYEQLKNSLRNSPRDSSLGFILSSRSGPMSRR